MMRGRNIPWNSQLSRYRRIWGAEVSGIDLSEGLGGNLAGALREVWLDHGGFMVIRGQENLSAEAHIAFGAAMGPLFGAPDQSPLQDTVSRYIHPDYP